jgi:2-oxoglutarate ferredoxin oxidoreductase subunit gamma
MDQKSILLSGFGGQGVMFAGQLLAYAAMDMGFSVTWIPSYGPEMRGGTAHCTVMIADEEIGSPVAQHPEIVIAFNLPSFMKYEHVVRTSGLLLFNASLVESSSARTDISNAGVPATDIATQLGSARFANVVLLGSLIASSLLPIEINDMERALENHIPERHRRFVPENVEALRAGYSAMAQLV